MTRISSPPKASSTVAKRPANWSRSPILARATRALRPRSRMAVAVSSAGSRLRKKFTTTSAPSRARRSAIARPIPRPEPVTSATLPTDIQHYLSSAKTAPRDIILPLDGRMSRQTPFSLSSHSANGLRRADMAGLCTPMPPTHPSPGAPRPFSKPARGAHLTMRAMRGRPLTSSPHLPNGHTPRQLRGPPSHHSISRSAISSHWGSTTSSSPHPNRPRGVAIAY